MTAGSGVGTSTGHISLNGPAFHGRRPLMAAAPRSGSFQAALQSATETADPPRGAQVATQAEPVRAVDVQPAMRFEPASLPTAAARPLAASSRPLWSSFLETGVQAGLPTGLQAATPEASVAMSALTRASALPTTATLATPNQLAALPRPGQAERPLYSMQGIRGFDQTNPAEYDSQAQANTWGLSACSAASLVSVLRGAGLNVRIADVMRVMPNGMTPQLGLVSRPALVNAANHFGAQASDDVTSYELIRQATANGQPVLVSFTNATFKDGHWIAITGVDSTGVRVSDSSRYDMKHIPKDEFLRIWNGKGIRLAGLPFAS